MEAIGMKPFLTFLAALLVVGAAQASEVYKSKDAKGNIVYTDRPEVLPAEKLNVKTQQTDTVEAQRRYQEEMESLARGQQEADANKQAADKTASEPELGNDARAKRCKDAQTRYATYMKAQRLYEPGASESDRRYLSQAEMDAAREFAKKSMDLACAQQ
jgi:hypothetical protein